MLCPDNNAFEVFFFAKDAVMSGLRPHGKLREAPPSKCYSGANRIGSHLRVRAVDEYHNSLAEPLTERIAEANTPLFNALACDLIFATYGPVPVQEDAMVG